MFAFRDQTGSRFVSLQLGCALKESASGVHCDLQSHLTEIAGPEAKGKLVHQTCSVCSKGRTNRMLSVLCYESPLNHVRP